MKIISRIELYNKLWKHPFKEVCSELVITESRLRSICKEYKIPIPNSAYWTKLRLQKVVQKKELSDPKREYEISLERKHWIKEDLIISSIENDKRLDFKVSTKLTNPDPVVRDLLEILEKEKKHYSTETVSAGGGWGTKLPSVMAQQDNIKRLLKVADCLLKNFRLLGYEFDYAGDNWYIQSGQAKLNVSFRELGNYYERQVDGYSSQTWKPNGKLCVKFGYIYSKEFHDTASTPLEEQIQKILTFVALKLNEWNVQYEEIKARNEVHKNEERIQEGKRNQKEGELSSFKSFIAEAERWKRYKVLEEYYLHLINHVPEYNKDKLDWIKQKLDWYNPELNATDKILDQDVDKNTLEII